MLKYIASLLILVQASLFSESIRHEPVKAVLLDIEGTTTSISFVHDVLFPYAKKHVGQFILEHLEEEAVSVAVAEAAEIAGVKGSDQVIEALITWMNQDKKITPLKVIQGLLWKDGYQSGLLKGHVYEDAHVVLSDLKKQGMPLYIYSSGSVLAQKLLFSHSVFGDLTPLFSGHFDTTSGQKKESDSYRSIAGSIGIPTQAVLFVSDSVEELDAAKKAGMQTILIDRDNNVKTDSGHLRITSFSELQF